MAGWHFDAYCATFHDLPMENIRGALLEGLDLASWKPIKGKNGYCYAAQVTRNPHDKKSHSICDVFWSDDALMGVHVNVQGAESPEVARLLRNLPRQHRVTRADVRLDVIKAGEFDRLHAILVEFAKKRRMRVGYQGDWANNVERSFYVGSRTSVFMLRIYEKGQKEKSHPDWVRIELEVKPKGKQGYACQQWEPEEYLGASRWVREALAQVGIEALKSQSLGTVWRPSDKERAKAAMFRQYGALIREMAAAAPSVEEFGRTMLLEVDRHLEPIGKREVFDVPF